MTSHSLQNGTLSHQVQNCFRYRCRFPKIKRHFFLCGIVSGARLPVSTEESKFVVHKEMSLSKCGRGHLPMEPHLQGEDKQNAP